MITTASDNCKGVPGLEHRFSKSEFSNRRYCTKCGAPDPSNSDEIIRSAMTASLSWLSKPKQVHPMEACSDPKKPVKIEVRPTIINGSGVHPSTLKHCQKLSVYVILADDSESWVVDYNKNDMGKALDTAAKLSMLHQVPIKMIECMRESVEHLRRDIDPEC